MDTAIQPAKPATVEEFLAQHPTGSQFEGCYVVDRHPTVANAILLLAPKTAEIRAPWKKAAASCETVEIEGHKEFRLFDRMEGLLLWKRPSSYCAQAPEFQEGGAEAFEEAGYWTREEYEFNSDYAWRQDFGAGYSDYWFKFSELRARPVRIHFI